MDRLVREAIRINDTNYNKIEYAIEKLLDYYQYMDMEVRTSFEHLLLVILKCTYRMNIHRK